MIFQNFFQKKANAELSMRREIQNRLIFQPNPESFCRAIIFSLESKLSEKEKWKNNFPGLVYFSYPDNVLSKLR
jgi:hypothetical protein